MLHALRSFFTASIMLTMALFMGNSSVQAQESSKSNGRFELVKTESGYDVKLDGQLFTSYVTNSEAKPILWPIIGPEGSERTRAYPMLKGREGEANDHIHHRSLWFTHGEVNDVDFWAEKEGAGKTVHRKFVATQGGDTATIATENDWVSAKDEVILSDTRTITFGSDTEIRWIDFAITLTAKDKPVHFGDTKEGTFGIRVHETMKVDAKLGGKIINSEGLVDGEAWGKPASWVDYHGPVDGKRVGIAIMVHPSSFNYPGRWHVRTYGLFAANPFGESHFTGGAKTAGKTLAAGESWKLKYRVIFHTGDEKEGKISQHWDSFSKEAAK